MERGGLVNGGRPPGPVAGLWRYRALIWQLAKRDVQGRYRGSALGMVWSLLTPILMATVYTVVFGVILKTRWSPERAEDPLEFVVILFAGLVAFAIFSESVTRAPGIIVANPNYVKKVVFPIEVLPVVLLCTTVFHALMGMLVLLGASLAVFGAVPASALLVPVVLLPLCLMCLGFAWMLAALGVFLRDIGHIVSIAVGVLMFLSPLFFPITAIPERIRDLVYLNPVTIPVEQLSEVVIWGRMPDWPLLAAYTLVALVVLVLGYALFRFNKPAFADVL